MTLHFTVSDKTGSCNAGHQFNPAFFHDSSFHFFSFWLLDKAAKMGSACHNQKVLISIVRDYLMVFFKILWQGY